MKGIEVRKMRFKEKEIVLKDGTKCILRSPNEDDAKEMIDFLKTIAEETYFLSRYPEEVITDLDKEKEIIQEVLTSHRDVMISAFVNGEIIGNVGVRALNSNLKTKHRSGLGIAIIKRYWNKGLGNILMEEALKEAEKMGYEQIELALFSNNEKAKHIYEKHGFEIWGIMKRAFKLKDGTYYHEINMRKFLK